MENADNENNEAQQQVNPKNAMGYTRLLDNHYDPRIHERPWTGTSHLRDYKYNYSDSGLAYTMQKGNKLKTFRERHEIKKDVEDLAAKNKGFRWFREYESVYNNDIVVTIEFCTNCQEHQGSTRHDEEKYAFFANTLKREIISQYPVIKVLLKPLIIQPNDESTEGLYLRTRLGALEVQIYAKNNKGEVTKQTVFSKLKCKLWPSFGKVIDDISQYLPKDDFVVRLIDPNQENEENKEDFGSKKNQPSKIKGMYVVMRPVRNSRPPTTSFSEFSVSGTSRMNTQGTSRPTSAAIRPTSAISSTSMKSNLTKRTAKDDSKAPNATLKEFVEQADNFGVVLFKQIPHNIYEIEVLETQNFLPDKKVVNVFEYVEGGIPLKEEFELKDQTMSFCRIKLLDNGFEFTEATVMVSKRYPDADSKTAMLREKAPNTGVFEFMIDPGEYILTINKPGFPERKDIISASRGVKDIVIDIKKSASQATNERPSSRQRPPSSKGRHDQPTAGSKTNVGGNLDVIPQEESPAKRPLGDRNNHTTDPHAEEEKGAKKNERVKSALVKKVEFIVHDVDTEKPVPGAVILLEEIGQQFTTNEEGKCLIPVNKLNTGKLYLNHDNFFGMVEEYGGDDGIDFKNVPQKKFYLIPRPTNAFEVQLRFLPGGDSADQPRVKCAKFEVHSNTDDSGDIHVKHCEDGREIITLKNLLKKQGVFRITAEILKIDEFLHPESTFILSRYEDCEPLYIFPPPEELVTENNKLYWDVGFFADPAANPQFVEINGYSNGKIGVQDHLKEYQMLLNYLNNSKSDLKTLLGFKGPNAIEREGDIFVSKKNIYTSLDKYGLEVKNIDHLLSSARSIEGLYSFRECERRFGSLRPPFNFTQSGGKNDPGSGSDGEEEYLFEDGN